MGNKINVAIVGYGNVGKGVLSALKQNADITASAIFSRSPERVKKEGLSLPVYSIDAIEKLKGIDVAILCGGSKDDLPAQGPQFAALINTVDSFDNHSKIPEYFAQMDSVAKKSSKVAVISAGWDPGTFSLERVMGTVVIPNAKMYGFYGLSPKGGLSMGHSDALRTINGVKDARQYTHAIGEAIEKIRNGENPTFTARDMHWRECFVVLEEGADKEKVTQEIVSMPGYFEPYRTVVNFVTEEELKAQYAGFPHDGLVIGAGVLGGGEKALVEYRNTWESNPVATGHILVAHARAAYRLAEERKTGAFTILDIPPAYLTNKSREELLRSFV
ncbi:MAG: Meso-diaminopimelate D-dehydrogenase [Turneriella sp.]|nr:Meso-diaminopimelate D-dehydrogenase [Turneriella sp.]